MASRDLNAPNILFILSDDQGAWAMGCAGNEEIVTPNLDRLASTGITYLNLPDPRQRTSLAGDCNDIRETL